MRKSFVLAAMALVVILAAGVANAQQHVFWTHPGERVDYVGAVDDWTGSMAQRQTESAKSMIHGPFRDLRRSWAANNGNPDPYYGTGTSPASAPYGLGQYAYDNRSYGNYGYDNRGYHTGRYDTRHRSRGYNNRRDGYSRPATQADVRGWGVGNALLTAGTFVAGEIRANKRDKREDARHQEQMAELRDQREQRQYESETPRSSEARGYYSTATTRPSRPDRFNVRNGTGADFCIKGKTLSPRAGDSVSVDDPDNLEISAPTGKTICPVAAEFISEDTILVTCISQKGR